MGPFVIEALVKEKYDVTVITTNPEKTAKNLPSASATTITPAEYTIQALTPVLRGQDVVISLISRVQPDAQRILAEAAVEAGVGRMIPSYWGLDMSNPVVRSNPAVAPKLETEEHIRSLVKAGKITSSGVQTGAFLDWALERGLFCNLHGPTMVFNGGDVDFACTARADVAKAVLAILKDPEGSRNRDYCIQSVLVTQNRLLALAREADPERELKTIQLETKQFWDQSQEKFDRGERSPEAMRGFLVHGTFGMDGGCHPRVDNADLGIEMWEDEKLKELMRQVMSRGKNVSDVGP